MRYIKTYEENIFLSNRNKFWKVNTKMPEFAVSLEKIGVPKEKLLRMIDSEQYDNIKIYDYVYIGIEHYPSAHNGIWTWDEDGYGNCNYMGEIEPTQDEIKEWEFNNDTNKYNL